MPRIDIRGVIVPSDDLWIYEWFDMEATCPAMVRSAIDGAGGEALEVLLNSGGGDVQAGQEIYTMLRSYEGPVTIKIQSLAASAAAVVAMARESEISPVAQIMIHNVSTRARGDHRDMEHTAGVLTSADRALAAAFAQKTGKTQDEILEMMARETWLTAEEAVKAGFVDRVMFAQAAEPVRLAASQGTGLLPGNVIDYAKRHFNNRTAGEKARAEYNYMILEGKVK